MSDGNKNTALDRGLKILRFILLKKEAQRFTSIKNHFPGLTDSSLTRLLKALIASGYLLRNENGFYQQGPELEEWKKALLNESSALEVNLQKTVKDIAESSNCSASFCQLVNDDHLEFFYTHNLPEAWALCTEGRIMHFANDHAAALAYLDSLERQDVERLLSSEFSFIKDINEYNSSLKHSKREAYYIDEAKARIGLSRFAVPIFHEQVKGVFFIGLSTAELNIREQELAQILLHHRDEMLNTLD